MDENILEQPSFNSNNENLDNNIKQNEDGSIFGKFKDAKSLLEAYNNLQSEFTRKSQKLADLQKKVEENAVFNTYENIDDFVNSTKDSDKYKKEITEIIETDNEINSLPNKYHVAYKIIQTAENKSAQTLNDQNFIDSYIQNNSQIKENIISEYLSNLNNISTEPKTIQGSPTSIYFSPNTNKPRTLKEAGEIFKKMLN